MIEEGKLLKMSQSVLHHSPLETARGNSETKSDNTMASTRSSNNQRGLNLAPSPRSLRGGSGRHRAAHQADRARPAVVTSPWRCSSLGCRFTAGRCSCSTSRQGTRRPMSISLTRAQSSGPICSMRGTGSWTRPVIKGASTRHGC